MSFFMTVRPFDDSRVLFTNLPVADGWISSNFGKKRQASLTNEQEALEKLGEIAVCYAGWRDTKKPIVTRPLVAIFSRNHGITNENIIPFPRSMTKKMVQNFAAGGGLLSIKFA
ncbi:hypothetical protein RM11_0617 [Bartonella quintana RM-11]|nr:hypothetical protein RM11_0617 [Bartonella quintana RM-11]